MLITLYKIGGLLFRLLATNGFRVKAKKERFTAASSRCRQNLKFENFPSSFGRLRQNIAPKNVLHVQHDYFSSFNQSNHWFVALSLKLSSSDLKLPNETFTAAGSRYRGNFKYENLASSFDRLRQKIAPKSVSHVQNDYFWTPQGRPDTAKCQEFAYLMSKNNDFYTCCTAPHVRLSF